MILRIISYFKIKNILILNNQYEKDLEKYHISFDTEVQPSRKYELIITNNQQQVSPISLTNQAFIIITNSYSTNTPLVFDYNILLNLYKNHIYIIKDGLSKQEFRLRL